MTLTASQMPTSFAGEAFYYYKANIRGWSQQDRSFVRSVTSFVFAVPYALAVSILCAPAGCLYHTAQAIRWKWRAVVIETSPQANALAWEHLKAASIDLLSIPLGLVGISCLENTKESHSRLSWWFSSSQVRLEVEGEGLRDYQLPRFASLYWGATPSANFEACPYHKLRAYQFGVDPNNYLRRILPLNSRQLADEVCFGLFYEAHKSSLTWSEIWPRRSSFLSHSYTFVKNTSSSPDYRSTFRWKFAAYSIATVALAALFIFLMVLIDAFRLQNFFGFMYHISPAFFAAIAVCSIEAVKHWTFMRGSAEEALATRLFTEAARNENKQAKLSTLQEAFFWLHRAANRGYTPAQEKFGLALLMSLPNPLDRTDFQQLSIAREAIAWLQSAGQNRYPTILRPSIFDILPISSDLIKLGIQGDTSEEQLANLLRPLNQQAAHQHFYALLFPQEANNQENLTEDQKRAFAEVMLNGLIKPRQRRVAQAIQNATPLLPDLAALTSEWTI